MGWDLPVDEFFPDRKKLLLSKGDREMTLPELRDKIAELRKQGKTRLEWGRFAVEWHKKFAIPAACLVFGLLGLSLSLGSKKEARSSAFALSIAVIFVYYVLIRLGEQAGDTGMMSPWLSMWGANVVLGAIALALLWLNHREAAFDPLDPAHYLIFVPKVRQRREQRPAPPGERPRAAAPARPVVVVRIPRLTLRFPSLLDRYIARSWVANVVLVLARLRVHLLPRGVHGPDRRHPAAQGQRAGDLPLLRLPPLADRLHGGADRGAGGRAGHPRPPRPPQRDHRHEGGRHQRLPRGGAGARDGHPRRASSSTGCRSGCCPTTNKAAAHDRNVIKGRPAQSSDQFDRRWVLASDERFYNFDYIVEREAAPEHGVAEPARGGEFSVYGFSIYDVDPTSWDLRERLFASRAAWNGATRTYDLERGWRRTTGARSSFQPFAAQRVRVIGRDPGGEIEPPSYFRREEKPSDTMGFGELRGLHRLARGPRRSTWPSCACSSTASSPSPWSASS